MKSLLEPRDTPIEFFRSVEGLDLSIKREDRQFASFGSKLRKFSLLLDAVSGSKAVVVFGSQHSNYSVAISTFLRLYGIPIIGIFYSQNPDLQTVNSRIVEKNIPDRFHFRSRSDALHFYEDWKCNKKEYFFLPEFAFSKVAMDGLASLWANWDFSRYPLLIQDAGSGLTLLSALAHLDSRVKILAVAIGRPMEKLIPELRESARMFGVDEKSWDRVSFVNPKTSPGYNSVNRTLLNYIELAYKETGIFLEPVYSAKTLFTAEDLARSKTIQGRAVYIHQGGLLNHLGFFLENQL